MACFSLLACRSAPLSPRAVPILNQSRYFADLETKRPDLVATDCKANLIAKSEYRNAILGGSSMSILIKQSYGHDQQVEDEQWAGEYRQERERSSVFAAGYRVARYYDSADYFGYLVGIKEVKQDKNLLTHPFIDQRGIGFKVFFQVKNFATDLKVFDFRSFAEALAGAGFHGDLKVQLQPGTIRFKFNNIVVHAASRRDALLAEQVGLTFFAGKLEFTSRGVDVDVDPKGVREALDWSEYLCAGKFSDLPLDVKDYINEIQ